MAWGKRKAKREAEEEAAGLHRIVASQYEVLEAARMPTAAQRPTSNVNTRPGEVVFGAIDGASLLEARRGPSRRVSSSAGGSIPAVAGIRVFGGGSESTYHPGVENLTNVDRGQFVVTSQRCIFLGTMRTVEWSYKKILRVDDSFSDAVMIHVEGRTKTLGVLVGTAWKARLQGWLYGSFAVFEGGRHHEELIDHLERNYRVAYERYMQTVHEVEPPAFDPPAPDVQDPTATTERAEDIEVSRAMELVVLSQLGSASMLQRKLKISLDRAEQILDLLELHGIVGPSAGVKGRARDVFMTIDEFEALRDTGPS